MFQENYYRKTLLLKGTGGGQARNLPKQTLIRYRDRADHDIRLVSKSTGTFSTRPDTTILTDYAFHSILAASDA